MDGEKRDKNVIIRDARFSDIDPLTNLRPPRGLHADRIRDPQLSQDARYVVAEAGGKPVGFGVIHFQGDPLWDRPDQVPLVMDLWVDPNLRGRGIGKKVLRALEQSAREKGFPCVFLQVQAEKNPRAVELYRKLGYQPLQSRACRDPYHTVDDGGNVSEGKELIIDMQKWLD
jgi:ribosomal protein S18 acetylase RimI-like enzyme